MKLPYGDSGIPLSIIFLVVLIAMMSLITMTYHVVVNTDWINGITYAVGFIAAAVLPIAIDKDGISYRPMPKSMTILLYLLILLTLAITILTIAEREINPDIRLRQIEHRIQYLKETKESLELKIDLNNIGVESKSYRRFEWLNDKIILILVIVILNIQAVVLLEFLKMKLRAINLR